MASGGCWSGQGLKPDLFETMKSSKCFLASYFELLLKLKGSEKQKFWGSNSIQAHLLLRYKKLIFDRELTKCAVLGIDMLLLLGSSQNGILCTMQYTVNIYWVCNLHNCIHLHLCTCACIHLHTCVHLHFLLRSCNFFTFSQIFLQFAQNLIFVQDL